MNLLRNLGSRLECCYKLDFTVRFFNLSIFQIKFCYNLGKFSKHFKNFLNQSLYFLISNFDIFTFFENLVLLCLAITNGWATEANRKLEEALMKSYNRKHRPVKKDSTTMQIQIYLLIGHIEKVV